MSILLLLHKFWSASFSLRSSRSVGATYFNGGRFHIVTTWIITSAFVVWYISSEYQKRERSYLQTRFCHKTLTEWECYCKKTQPEPAAWRHNSNNNASRPLKLRKWIVSNRRASSSFLFKSNWAKKRKRSSFTFSQGKAFQIFCKFEFQENTNKYTNVFTISVVKKFLSWLRRNSLSTGLKTYLQNLRLVFILEKCKEAHRNPYYGNMFLAFYFLCSICIYTEMYRTRLSLCGSWNHSTLFRAYRTTIKVPLNFWINCSFY